MNVAEEIVVEKTTISIARLRHDAQQKPRINIYKKLCETCEKIVKLDENIHELRFGVVMRGWNKSSGLQKIREEGKFGSFPNA